MKVSECLKSIPETNLGYIRMTSFIQGGDGIERMLDTFSNRELVDVQNKDAVAYYNIGQYWYIVYGA